MLASTLHASLDRAAARRPESPVDFPSERRRTTLGALARDSVAAAGALARAGVRQGDRIGVLCPNEPDFLIALFAASRLGCAACPLPVPTGPRDAEAYLARLGRIARTSDMRHLVLSPGYGGFAEILAGALPGVTLLPGDALTGAEAVDAADALPPVAEETPVIVQFTSGSTADPKGVELSHANVLACLRAIAEAIELGDRDSLGMWLPLFHDMGLFATLSALFAAIPATLWSPVSFVKRPDRWLREFAASGSTISASPDFGYAYLTAAVGPDEAAELDLSRWRIAFNGAETIRRDSVEAFLERFTPAGFRPGALMTVYGMAEATLAVTFPPLGRAPRWDVVDRVRLATERVAVPVDEDSPAARPVACVGRPVLGMEVRVAGDGSAEPLPDGRIGEVLIRGASVTRGYLMAAGRPQPFEEGGWLRTGDLGYLRAGELYLTGRIKEMIVVRGENYYPHDAEDLARTHPGVHKQRCVAYADTAPDGSERIVLAAESETASTAGDDAPRAALEKELRDLVAAGLGLDAVTVHVVAPRTLPRTSSGKFQRLAARDAVAAAGPASAP
ncbi:AMP-binding protein [Streptomyces coeruleoprunus]|uniref:AMP-binding protein n=1 Tax=Streptomyces coeruleoprunus TaxID=285563 RepID=A0ABV9XEL5_9ACTN